MGGARNRSGRTAVFRAVSALAALGIGGVLAAGFGSGSAGAQQGPPVEIAHGPPVVPKVFARDLRDFHQPHQGKRRARDRPEEPLGGFSKPSATVPPTEAPTVAIPSPSVSFKGLDFNTWGAGWPPDPVGDVGPNHYVQAVNTSIGIFGKTGTQLAAFTFDTLWASAATGTACDTGNQGDPTVVYDPMGDRWIVADFAFTGNGSTGPYYECIAVSRTSDPVAGGWYLYAVRTDDATHPWFADYPKMGIWPDGLYMSANMFQGDTFREVRVWAFNRADLESGAPLRSVVVDLNTTTYFSLLPSNLRGASPPTGRPNFFVSESQTLFAFHVFKFHADYSGSGSTFTGPTNVSQTSYTVASSTVPSPANSLDSLRERLMMQAQYRNLGGTESLWVNHTVKTAVNGVTGIQWAQINVTGGTVVTTPVQQQIYGNVGGDKLHRWMGSLAVDKDGNMALGYSVSSSTLAPDIRYAGRLATDPLNTLPQGETTMLSGVTRGSQSGNCGGAVCTRWGDYSAMSVDPDGCTFWYTNEYYEATGLNWQTRIGSFKFAPCTPADTNPPTASNETASTDQGVAVPVTLHGSDVEVCELTFSIVAAPANGSLGPITNNLCASGSPNADTASVTYTPSAGFSGTDSFTYKVNDGTSDSNIATVSIAVSAPATYDQVVLADSPAAYWRLGESSGSAAADSSGNGNAGTYQNGVTLGAAGLIGGGNTAASFDGVDDRVVAFDTASLSPTNAVSAEAWVRATTFAPGAGTYRTIVFKANSYWLRVDNVGGVQRARFYIRDGGTYFGATSAVTLTAGTTYHPVGTYDGTTLRIYVNGVLQGSAAHTGAVDDTTSAVVISNPPSNAWDGRLDEIAIYNTALSTTRVQAHYASGAPPPDYKSFVLSDSPAAYWRLGESSGSAAADSSGNGNAGTYQNGVTLGAAGLIGGGNTAASFDGVDDRVVAFDTASLSPTNAVSAEAWVRATTFAPGAGTYRTIVFKANSYWLRVDNVGGVQRARFYIRDGGTYFGATSAVTLTAGTTYHPVGTYDGTTLRIYVNGVLQGSAAHTGAVDDTTSAVVISNPPSNAWDGRLDEIAVYPAALSASAIQQHYSQGLVG